MSTTTTAIAWTDAAWNPLRGCSRVSTGCEHCYAARQAGRFSGPGQPYAGLVRKTSGGWRWTGEVRLIAKELETPLRWTKPRRIFVNSMSDLFQESVSEDLVDAVLAVMALAPQHTFQVLTKRPARMLAYLTERWPPARVSSLTLSGTRRDLPVETPGADRHQQILNAADRLLHGPLGAQARFWTPDGAPRSHAQPWPLPNVWWGVSVENQATADARIPWLLQTPAAVDFSAWLPDEQGAPPESRQGKSKEGLRGAAFWRCALNWLLCGGESGPGGRPCELAWLRSSLAQCQAAQGPCFVKQLGAQPWDERAVRLHHPAEWPADLRVQQFP